MSREAILPIFYVIGQFMFHFKNVAKCHEIQQKITLTISIMGANFASVVTYFNEKSIIIWFGEF